MYFFSQHGLKIPKISYDFLNLNSPFACSLRKPAMAVSFAEVTNATTSTVNSIIVSSIFRNHMRAGKWLTRGWSSPTSGLIFSCLARFDISGQSSSWTQYDHYVCQLIETLKVWDTSAQTAATNIAYTN